MAKILVVDCDVMVRWRLMNVLTSFGHEVALSACSNEALKMYQKAKEDGKPFDLLITDFTADNSEGREFLKAINSIDSRAKCIVSNTYIINGDIQSDIMDNTFEFLPKPYKVKELCEVISRMS